jgi:hypothetical protein
MNTVFARAVFALGLVALGLVALPTAAAASTSAASATSPKHTTKHSHSHSVANKKDAAPKKKGKHHGHKASSKAVAAHPKDDATAPEESATKAP